LAASGWLVEFLSFFQVLLVSTMQLEMKDSGSDNGFSPLTVDSRLRQRGIPMFCCEQFEDNRLQTWSLPLVAASKKRMIASSPRWKRQEKSIYEECHLYESELEYYGLCYDDVNRRKIFGVNDFDSSSDSDSSFVSEMIIHHTTSSLVKDEFDEDKPFLFVFVEQESSEEYLPKSIYRKPEDKDSCGYPSDRSVSFDLNENCVRIIETKEEDEDQAIEIDFAFDEFRQVFPFEAGVTSKFRQKWQADAKEWRAAGGSGNRHRHELIERANAAWSVELKRE